MRKFAIATTAVATVAMLALAGCSSPRGTDAGTGTDGGTDAAGFAAGSVIGVALPDKTSENWTIAGGLFEDAITEAGFEPNVQYAGSTSPAPTSRHRSAR